MTNYLNTVLQVIGVDFISKLSVAALTGILIAAMHPNDYASYTVYIAAITAIYSGFCAGINRCYIVQKCDEGSVRCRDGYLMLQILVSLLLALIAGLIFGCDAIEYFIIVALTMATVCFEFGKAVIQARAEFKLFSYVELMRTGLFLIGVVVVFNLKDDLRTKDVMFVQTACASAAAMIAINLSRISVKKEFNVGWNALGNIMTGGNRFLIMYATLIAAFTQLDIFILRVVGKADAVAAYGAAYRYYGLAGMVLGSMHNVLLPLISSVQSSTDIAKVLKRQNKIALLLSPMLIIAAATSYIWIPIIDGGKYPESIICSALLLSSTVISFYCSPHVNVLIRWKDERYLVTLLLKVAVFGGVGLLCLILKFGATGAAIATVLNFAVLNIFIWRRANNIVKRCC